MTFWAWDQVGMKGAQKLVLLCLANHHNESTNQCNPSVISISEVTGLDRKTVMKSIEVLKKLELISVKKSHGSGNLYSFNQYQKRDYTSTKNGTTQKRDYTSTKNGTQPVPKTGREPKKNLKGTLNNISKDPQLDFSKWKKLPTKEIWTDYEKMRKTKKATITQTVINTIGKQVNILIDLGYSVDDIISECVTRNWQGLDANWIHKGNNHGTSKPNVNGKSYHEKREDFLDSITDYGRATDF